MKMPYHSRKPLKKQHCAKQANEFHSQALSSEATDSLPPRQRGGYSDAWLVNALQVLAGESQNLEQRKVLLTDIGSLLNFILQRAAAGDPLCGWFLGEWIPYLNKQTTELSKQNKFYRKQSLRVEAYRQRTARESGLRIRARSIINDTQVLLRNQRLTERLAPGISFQLAAVPTAVASLPPLSKSAESVQAWSDYVYDRLRECATDLESDPVIGQLRKLRDIKGNFQVSNIREVLPPIVRRIAETPITDFVSLQ